MNKRIAHPLDPDRIDRLGRFGMEYPGNPAHRAAGLEHGRKRGNRGKGDHRKRGADGRKAALLGAGKRDRAGDIVGGPAIVLRLALEESPCAAQQQRHHDGEEDPAIDDVVDAGGALGTDELRNIACRPPAPAE